MEFIVNEQKNCKPSATNLLHGQYSKHKQIKGNKRKTNQLRHIIQHSEPIHFFLRP